ncbi:SDR family oxidoreductase [Streptomyces sediminimaris]|uniref:SDR family oxidoreductase n=1 Tax=Streptomyces sediminimaris TaxID=3383721 RepID=UPI00399B6B90
MRVFVTGATGHIGSLVVPELRSAGHEVVGLARSEASAAALAAAGAEAHRGTLDDLGSLRKAAVAADGVIHLAFIHDFADHAAAAATDLRAIEAIGDALEGSDKPFVVTSGTAGLKPGRVVTEEDPADARATTAPRAPSENAAIALAGRGVRSSVIRLAPSVHGPYDAHGFIPRLIRIAADKGVSAYVGTGSNRWPAVHELDAARLYRLALEAGPAGSRLHGVGEEAVPFRAVAQSIGRHLGVPVRSVPPQEAAAHFGWLGALAALDVPASSARTRALLGWRPVYAGLLADLDELHYFRSFRSRTAVAFEAGRPA